MKNRGKTKGYDPKHYDPKKYAAWTDSQRQRLKQGIYHINPNKGKDNNPADE